MSDLARQTGCDCVMTRLFTDEVIDTHRESPADGLNLAYGRGRPRPLFLGAAPKVILATLPRAKLERLYKKFSREIFKSGLASTWEQFWENLQRTKKAGYYISKGELEPDVGAIAVPLFGQATAAIGALALVMPVHRVEFMNHEKLLDLLLGAADKISNSVRQAELTT